MAHSNGLKQRRRVGLTVGVEDRGLKDSFAEAIEQALTEAAGNRISFFDWAIKVPEPKRPLDFTKFPMQQELYQEGFDDSRGVVMKSTQVGVSAWALRWMMYHADTRGFTGLYLLPRREDVYDFSDARIKPVIENSSYLSGRVSPEDPSNKGLRKVGLGLLYFRGSETKRGLDTADVDALVMDEYDTLNQENIPDAERRLSGITSANLLRRVGVPSIPNWGIAKMYEDSDKRQWLAKCEHCGEWQTPTFLDNVDQFQEILVCRDCHKKLNVANGHWVAQHPDRDTRGYHLTRLIAPGANLHDIIVASKQRLPHQRQTFFNKDLGEPFAPEEGRLSRQAISACVREFSQEMGYVGNNLVTMGIDVASTRALNVRISEHIDDVRRKALLLKEVENFDDLALLMDRFQVNMACIDHLPEGRLARSFAERFAGRVMIVSYNTNPSPKDDKVLQVNEESRMVSARRVEAMDATAEQFRQQHNLLPADLPHGYVDALQAPVRVVQEDELGRKTVSYRSMGQDDWFHAEVYDLIASEMFLWRSTVEHARKEELSTLDDHLEFQRSGLGDYQAESEYEPGGVDEYDRGLG